MRALPSSGIVRASLPLVMRVSRFLTTARARFEAARTVPAALDPRLRGRHGHGFVVDAAVTDPHAPLASQLAGAVSPFQYADLDALLDDRSDEGILTAVAERWRGTVPRLLVLSATPQGRLERHEEAGWVTARRFGFEAAHWLPHVPPGHKCGRLHGHSYEVLIRAGGLTATQIDAAWLPLGALLGSVCLNSIDGLANPTSELLASWLYARLAAAVPTLTSVTVYETGRCGATFDGVHHSIWRSFTFDAAVRERAGEVGTASLLCGHTYRLKLHLRSSLDAVLGWAVDFGDVQRLFAPVYDLLDHRSLMDLPAIKDVGVAGVAAWIDAAARPLLPALCRVDVETAPGEGVQMGTLAAAPYPL